MGGSRHQLPQSVPLCRSEWQRTGMGLRQEAAGSKVGKNSQMTFGLRNYCCGCLCRPLCKVISEKKRNSWSQLQTVCLSALPHHTTPHPGNCSPLSVKWFTTHITSTFIALSASTPPLTIPAKGMLKKSCMGLLTISSSSIKLCSTAWAAQVIPPCPSAGIHPTLVLSV